MSFIVSFINSLPSAVTQGMIWGIMAMGVYITYKILDIADLTVDATLCTGGAVCAIMTMNGVNIWVSIICAIIAGALAGLVTGLLNTKFGIPAILAGILTQLGLYSINRSNLPISVDKYRLLVSSRYVRELSSRNPIIMVLIFVAVTIGILYWFFGTEIGCSLRSTGANEKMSRAQGIDTDSAKVIGLMISNGLVAFSGALLTQYQGFSDINMGRGAIVIGLAAVIIGEVIFSKVFRNFALILLACVLGAVIYYIVIQFVLKLGLSTDDLKLLTAVVVTLFLAIPYWKARYNQTHVKGGK